MRGVVRSVVIAAIVLGGLSFAGSPARAQADGERCRATGRADGPFRSVGFDDLAPELGYIGESVIGLGADGVVTAVVAVELSTFFDGVSGFNRDLHLVRFDESGTRLSERPLLVGLTSTTLFSTVRITPNRVHVAAIQRSNPGSYIVRTYDHDGVRLDVPGLGAPRVPIVGGGRALAWRGDRVLTHAGFDGVVTSIASLDVVTGVSETIEYAGLVRPDHILPNGRVVREADGQLSITDPDGTDPVEFGPKVIDANPNGFPSWSVQVVEDGIVVQAHLRRDGSEFVFDRYSFDGELDPLDPKTRDLSLYLPGYGLEVGDVMLQAVGSVDPAWEWVELDHTLRQRYLDDLDRFYLVAFGRRPGLEGRAYWLGRRTAALSRSDVLAGLLQSSEFTDGAALTPAMIAQRVLPGRTLPDGESRAALEVRLMTADDPVEVVLDLADHPDVARATGTERPAFTPQQIKTERLYLAALGRFADPGGLCFWMDYELRRGERWVAVQLLNSPEFRERFGSPDDEGFVRLLYRNVLGRVPVQPEVDDWVAVLAQDGVDRADLILWFAGSAEFERLTEGR